MWLDGMEVTQFTISSNAAALIASPFRLRSPTGSSGWRCISKTWKASGTSAGTASAVTARSGCRLKRGSATSTLGLRERLKQLFAIYEAEAADLIEKQLPAPA